MAAVASTTRQSNPQPAHEPGSEVATNAVAAVPHPVFKLVYERRDITSDITAYVESVTYTDYLSGQSDEIEVVLEDTDGRWLGAWYPGKGDRLSLSIGYADKPLLPCGSFEIDELEAANPPSTVSIRALSTGIKQSVRTRNGRAYENTTLAAIAGRIAKRNRLTLTGKIRDVPIDRVTQYQENDVAFLTRLSAEYGYAFKIVGSKLVFTELATLRGEATAVDIFMTEMTSRRLRDKIKDVYAQAQVKHHDPKNKSLVVYGVQGNGQVGVVSRTSAPQSKNGHTGAGTSGDTLKLAARADSKANAQVKAQAALDAANLKQTTGTIALSGNPKLVAGVCVNLPDVGRLSGKYLIESARHQMTRTAGYTTELEIHRVADPHKPGQPSPRKAGPSGGLKVYGIDANGNVGVVGTTPKPKGTSR